MGRVEGAGDVACRREGRAGAGWGGAWRVARHGEGGCGWEGEEGRRAAAGPALARYRLHRLIMASLTRETSTVSTLSTANLARMSYSSRLF